MNITQRLGSTLLILLTSVIAGGCPANSDGGGTMPGATNPTNYRTVLLAYGSRDLSAARAAPIAGGWLVAVEPQIARDGIEFWTIRDGKIASTERLTAKDAQLPCPSDHPPQLLGVKGLSLNAAGDGLLVASGGCEGLQGAVALFFERTSGSFRLLSADPSIMPDGFQPVGVACGPSACAFLLTVAPKPAELEGPSSFTVARFRNGAWDALVLDERESDDNRLFNPSAIVALGDAFVVTGFESTQKEQTARAFRIVDTAAEPLDFASYDHLTAPVVTGEQAWAGATKPNGESTLFAIPTSGAPLARAERSAAATAGLYSVAALEDHIIEAREVSRAPEPGYDNELRLDETSLGFPKVSLGASVRGLSVSGDELLVFGSQFARKPNAANPTAPLFILISKNAAIPSAEPLPDAPADACVEAKDCAGATWAAKCNGHFACEASACKPICDFVGCGDKTCDVGGGETPSSCPGDCLTR